MAAGTLSGKVGVRRGTPPPRVVRPAVNPSNFNLDDPVHAETTADVTIGAGTADALAAYFKPWADRLPHGAVGAFLGLLGNGKDDALIQLAENWLGPDVSVEGMRRDLASADGRDPCATVRVFVSGRVAQGQRVEAVNLLGALVEMDAGSDGDTVFAIDPVRRSSHLGSFWEIRFREVDPRRRTAHELVALMGSTVEWWAVRVPATRSAESAGLVVALGDGVPGSGRSSASVHPRAPATHSASTRRA